MDGEIQTFTKIWLTATASLIFCHQIAAKIPAGAARLLSLLPIFYLFTTLPLRLSSFHLGAPTIFYLVWLGNFKLLLFAFDQGPLSPTPPLSLLHFISIGLLPIKTKHAPSPNSSSRPILFLVKCGLLTVIVSLYKYRELMHAYPILALYCCHVYLGVELVLAITAVPVRAVLGLELEPQFNEPYFATSLQDFWGRRWNLMVTSILRPTTYHPVRRISTRILGKRWALAPAILATFLVSGLMHEVIYYYLTRVRPTWEVTWFFVVHGVMVAVEIGLKKALTGGWGLHRAVSGPLTVAIVAVTGGWLFFPQVIRNGLDVKAINEYSILVSLIVLGWGNRVGDGVLGNYPNLRSGWDHCIPLRQNLLQQRTLRESVTSDIGYYCNSMLLDDVGNSVPSADETTHCSHFERIRVIRSVRSMCSVFI